MKTTTKQFIIHCLLPLIFGVVVYAIFRKDSIFYCGSNIFFSNNFLLTFIRNHLCDALWAYSVTSALLIATNVSSRLLALISIIFFWLMEWGTGIYFNQTFDWIDVIIMSSFCLVAITIVKRN